MKKLFTLFAASLFAIGMWAETVTFTLADIFDGSQTSQTVTSPTDAVVSTNGSKSNANETKISNDGNYFQVVLTSEVFSAASFNGYINSNDQTKNWGFQFSTDGGETWGTELTQANDGNKAAHDIEVSVEIPSEANGIRIIRRSGTTAYLYSISLELESAGPAVTYTVTYKANNNLNQTDVVDDAAKKVKANMFEAEEGFAFAGWNTAADGSGTDYAVGVTLESNLTLYAQWEEISACTILIPEISGSDPAKGDEIALNAASEGGAIYVAGMKADGDIKYTEYGLQIGGGGADSIRIELNNYLKEGSIITLNLAAGGDSERGLNIQTLGKSTVYQAKWTPAAKGEEKSFEYVVPAGSPLIGANKFLLQRNNTVYLVQLTVANCGEAVPGIVTVVSQEESLSGLSVNGEEVAASVLAGLKENKSVALDAEFAVAPVIGFGIHTVTTYSDESVKESDRVQNVTATEKEGVWEAKATIAEVEYTVTAVKPTTVTVTYMDGATKLGEETLKKGETVKENAKYEVKPLAEFKGWFTDAELTAAADLTAAVNADLTLYAKFEKAFAQSLNIEQLVLDEGTGADIKAILTAKGYAYDNIDALDTLNDADGKVNRNYAYLGLKLKKASSSFSFNLKQGTTVKVRFGAIQEGFVINVDGTPLNIETTSLANSAVTDNQVFEYTAEAGDAYIEFNGLTEKKTVVLKQIMINEEIAAVVLPGEDSPEAIDNAKAAVKAQKVIRDGQLIIIRDGKELNVLGTVIR
ncbi:MAG: InlB B-repeat-containing protein [Paludibacteraceae bacterium]|nr:InlB B-repeat-containing protein [Paludibacteraceae bacterium]